MFSSNLLLLMLLLCNVALVACGAGYTDCNGPACKPCTGLWCAPKYLPQGAYSGILIPNNSCGSDGVNVVAASYESGMFCFGNVVPPSPQCATLNLANSPCFTASFADGGAVTLNNCALTLGNAMTATFSFSGTESNCAGNVTLYKTN